MKDIFKEYIVKTEEQKRAIWDNAVIVFDTNILLNLYRYTVGTRDELLSAMQTHQEKLWLPYQVGFEYFNKRLDIIDKMANANTSLKESLDSLSS